MACRGRQNTIGTEFDSRLAYLDSVNAQADARPMLCSARVERRQAGIVSEGLDKPEISTGH